LVNIKQMCIFLCWKMQNCPQANVETASKQSAILQTTFAANLCGLARKPPYLRPLEKFQKIPLDNFIDIHVDSTHGSQSLDLSLDLS